MSALESLDAAAWPELAPAALHGVAGQVVELIAPETEADPVALLVSLLAAFGSAAGAGPHVVADGARHPARLFAVLAGKTSRARKGTSWRHVISLFELIDPTWARGRVLGGLSSGEGLIAAVGDGEPDKEGFLVGAVSDKRLFAIEEEFARTLIAKGRDGSTLSQILRLAWDTGDLRVITKRAQVATGAHISILGHVTVEELRRSMTETDQADGLANRFLFALVRRSHVLPEGGQVDFARLERFARNVGSALETARKTGRVERSSEAKAYWADLYRRLVEDETEGLAGAVVARAEAQALRLSLIYALLDGSPVIEVEHVQAAEALWSYCDASARWVFGDALGDPVADRLLEAIRSTGSEGMDGSAQYHLFQGHVSRDRREGALRTLEDRGLVVTRQESTGGRSRLVSVASVESVQSVESHPTTGRVQSVESVQTAFARSDLDTSTAEELADATLADDGLWASFHQEAQG